MPILQSSLKVSFVGVAVSPLLDAEALRLILFPSPLIETSLFSLVPAGSLSLIIDPLAFVKVTIGMDEFSRPISLVVLPVAFIDRTVRPLLKSIPFSFLLAVNTPSINQSRLVFDK